MFIDQYKLEFNMMFWLNLLRIIFEQEEALLLYNPLPHSKI